MLAAKENTLERMTAQRNVRMTEGTHTVTGAATLDYKAEDEQYVVTSDGTTRVVVVTRDNGNCRQDSGNSITFFKGNSKIIIDGQQRNNTSTGPSKSACSPSTR
jgi:lipopolysaccharide export system protein LptA